MVNVTAGGASQVQTQSENVVGTITEQEVRSTGLNGRNFTQIIAMAPGVSNQNGASANVINLQKRVAGVLPVAINVPRTGTSFAFVRPLVLDEETKVTFSYKTR